MRWSLFVLLFFVPFVSAQEATTTRVWRYTPTLEDVEKGNFCFFFDHASYKRKLGTPKLAAGIWPQAPVPFDHGAKIKYPMLLNDQLGCCFYSGICHQDQTWTGWRGPQSQFDLAVFRQRYLSLSGGDRGLSDQDVQGEWKNRYLADVKEAKAFDYQYINVTDPSQLDAAIYEMGGVNFTFTVANAWISNSDEGALWEADTYRQNNNGHAVLLVAVKVTPAGRKYYKLITWGTYVWIHEDAIKVCNPDGFVAASVRWFDAKGYAGTGRHVTQLSDVYAKASGRTYPASVISLFPPLTPDPVPVPPVPVPTGKSRIVYQTPGQPDKVLLELDAPVSKGKTVPDDTPQELIDVLFKLYGPVKKADPPGLKKGATLRIISDPTAIIHVDGKEWQGKRILPVDVFDQRGTYYVVWATVGKRTLTLTPRVKDGEDWTLDFTAPLPTVMLTSDKRIGDLERGQEITVSAIETLQRLVIGDKAAQFSSKP